VRLPEHAAAVRRAAAPHPERHEGRELPLRRGQGRHRVGAARLRRGEGERQAAGDGRGGGTHGDGAPAARGAGVFREVVEVVGRHWKTVAKALVALVILGFVGRQFYRDLSHPDLALLQIRWGWLFLSPAIYLAGLGFSAWFWRHVLALLGPRLGW